MKLSRASIAILLFLSACYGLDRVDELRVAPLAPSPFHQELARLYLRFVDNELDKYDWDTAGYFAGKGLDAAQGADILPEDPGLWDTPDYALDELLSARLSILAKLTPSFVASSPSEAAAMVFHYDCWVEEQEEAWETAAIEACKQQVLLRLDETDSPVAMGGPLSTSYLLRFEQGAAKLEGMARDELQLIASTVSSLPGAYALIINGHADQPGKDGKDESALSHRRGEYIRSVLRRRGVPKERIYYHPLSDTPMDDMSSPPAAQRIELFIE